MIGPDICLNFTRIHWVTFAMKIVSLIGDNWLPYLLTLAIGIVFFCLKKKIFAYAIILAPAVGDIIKLVLKNIIQRPRPGFSNCFTAVNLNDYSMPSGHTIFYTVFFGLLAWYAIKECWNRWYGKVLALFSIVMIVLVGPSRIYLGVHWISDVLAGYIIGGLVLAITIRIINKYDK